MGALERFQFLNARNTGTTINGKHRISEEISDYHSLMLGRSGKGKSTVFAIPNLLNLRLDQSAVVTDPSGELLRTCGGYLAEKGFEIRTINYPHPEHSFQTNPLHRANTKSEISELVDMLIDAQYGGEGKDDPVWLGGASTIINTLAQVVKKEGPEHANFHNVLHLVQSLGSNPREVHGRVFKNADPQTQAQYISVYQENPKTVQGFLSTSKGILAPFSNPTVAHLTARETLHFEDLRKKPLVIFLVIPEDKIERYRFFLNIFYSQLFSFLMEIPEKSSSEKEEGGGGPAESGETLPPATKRRGDKKEIEEKRVKMLPDLEGGKSFQSVTCLLDEFGQMRVNGFAGLSTTLRKRKVRLLAILQDYSQLRKQYGPDDAETILNGSFASKIYTSGLSQSLCEELARTLGEKTIQVSEPDGRSKQDKRSLMTAHEIRTLKNNEALYIFDNRPPILMKLRPYFKSWRMRRRASIPLPELPVRNGPVVYLDIDIAPEILEQFKALCESEKEPGAIEAAPPRRREAASISLSLQS